MQGIQPQSGVNLQLKALAGTSMTGAAVVTASDGGGVITCVGVPGGKINMYRFGSR